MTPVTSRAARSLGERFHQPAAVSPGPASLAAAAPDRRISTRYRPIARISPAEVREMHRIFSRYYENTLFDTFASDLKKKSGAFLIRRKADGRIVGFSTLAVCRMEVDGRPIKGLFNGDTILEKEYWGSRAFRTAFLFRLVIEALKNPFTPQYWFLISKGYKTYLLLSNNFTDYYPRRDRADGRLRRIVEAYCEKLFPGVLDRGTMLLDFGAGYNRLKDDVAPITPALRQREPNIDFFEKCNPTWRRGTELPAVGRADLIVLVKLAALQVWKALFRPSRSRQGAGGAGSPRDGSHLPTTRIATEESPIRSGTCGSWRPTRRTCPPTGWSGGPPRSTRDGVRGPSAAARDPARAVRRALPGRSCPPAPLPRRRACSS